MLLFLCAFGVCFLIVHLSGSHECNCDVMVLNSFLGCNYDVVGLTKTKSRLLHRLCSKRRGPSSNCYLVWFQTVCDMPKFRHLYH